MFHCPLTDIRFQDQAQFFTDVNSPVFHYRFHPIGEVKITLQALAVLRNLPTDLRRKLAGISRNKYESGEKNFVIESTTWKNDLKEFSIPADLEEKQLLLLNHINRKSEGNTKRIFIQNNIDYPITFSVNEAEFDHVLDSIKEEGLIDWDHSRILRGGIRTVTGIRLTKAGRGEIKKSMPQSPMTSLVTQQITTGNVKIDEKIEQAKKLFFVIPENMENMRNGCETLCFVLEPLRKDLQQFFSNPDVNAFFQIVNDFDIRHNKPHTKQLIHKEQLEWIFYSLLNTISIYVKLKNKLHTK